MAIGTEHFGPIDVLVNNAAVPGSRVPTHELSVAEYLRMIEVDQHGVFYGMRAVLPGMIEAGRGSIVNISSMAGMAHAQGSPNAAYTAAKFAVRGLSRRRPMSSMTCSTPPVNGTRVASSTVRVPIAPKKPL